ncbi:PAS domain S-box protein [Pleurocapsales cyanobacterium LEGE 06147]|nr:PAS domain S-box protein [Pleurocapsales cyanobacterium LEGE 06147]
MQQQRLPIYSFNLEEVLDCYPLIVSPDTPLSEALDQMSRTRGRNCSLYELGGHAETLRGARDSIDQTNFYLPTDEQSIVARPSSYALVMSQERLVGIFTERDLVKLVASGVNVTEATIADVMTQPVITLAQSQLQDVFFVLSYLHQHRIRHLPILDERQRLLGVITLNSIRQALKPLNFLQLRRVIDVMHEEVIHAPPHASVLHLAQLMTEHQVSCVVICKGSTPPKTSQAEGSSPEPSSERDLQGESCGAGCSSSELLVPQDESSGGVREDRKFQQQPLGNLFSPLEKRFEPRDAPRRKPKQNPSVGTSLHSSDKERLTPIGIVTERDIVQFQSLGLNLAQTKAETVMSTPLLPLMPQDSLWSAQQKMQQHRVRRLVVTDEGGKLMGIVSQTSLLRVLDPVEMLGELEQLQQVLERQTVELRQINQQLHTEIAEKTRIEAALQQTNNILEQRVDLKTAQLLRANEEFRRVNRALKTLSNCNQALVRASTETDLLNNICQILVTVGGYRMAWVGFVEHDESKSIIPVAKAGLENGYLATLNLTRTDTEREKGSTGVAVRTAQPCVFQDIWVNSDYELWREQARQRGYAASIALPLITNDRVFGVLNLYSARADAFDPTEVQLLSELADDLTYGIMALRAHKAREQSEEKFRQLTENIDDVFWMSDADKQKILYVSPAYERIWGRSCQSLYANPKLFLETIHPEDYQQMLLALKENPTACFDVEYRIVRPDGSVRWIWDRGFPIVNERREIYRRAGIAKDITAAKHREAERKQAEQALKRERDFNAAVLNTVGALIVVSDRHGRMVSFNRTCEQISGYCFAEVRGKCLWDFLLVEEEKEVVKAVYQRLLAGQFPDTYENYWVSKNGDRHLISWSNTALLDSEGKVEYVIATGINITEQRKAQDKLERQHRQAQLLAEVTRKIRKSLRLEEILQTTVTEVQNLLACDRVLIVKLQPNGTVIPLSEAVLPGFPSMLGWEMADPLLQGNYLEQYRQGQILAIADLARFQIEPEVIILLKQFAIRAKLVVPILSQDCLKGLLIVHQCSSPRQWQDWEIELLQQLADQISVALSQAQLLNHLEELVTERTAELTAANQQLQQEIRERQLTAQALRESEQKLAGILDTADEAVISIDENQRIQIFNQGAEKIFGYRSNEVLGQALDMLLPEAFRSIHRQHIRDFGNFPSLSRRMGDRNSEVVGLRKNGQQFPAEASISKLQSRQGLIFTVMLKDITERKLAEEELRRREEQLRLITNALPILIAYIDAQQRYRFNNQAHEDWFGLSCTQIDGLFLRDVIGRAAYQKICPYVELALSGQSVTFEVELPDKQKSYRWVSASFIPNLEGESEVKGFFAMISDISDRKVVEQMKSEFVSVASHEMRTPLTSIHGVLRLLSADRLGNLSQSGREMVAIALKNTDRLVRLINDVLDLERLESGKVMMEKQLCKPIELIEQATATIERMAHQNEITLCIEEKESKALSSLQLWADCDHIIQTLTNLLSNAIKFSPPQSKVWLKVESLKDEILFQIKDQGRGIPADKLETIFERFQQVDGSNSRKMGGTGLGLAICRKIVQQHEGRIWAESTVGEGTTFYFTLPAIKKKKE